jgi:hypothetical protein
MLRTIAKIAEPFPREAGIPLALFRVAGVQEEKKAIEGPW